MPKPETIGFTQELQPKSIDAVAVERAKQRLLALAARKGLRQQQIEIESNESYEVGVTHLPLPRTVLEYRALYMHSEQTWDSLMNMLHVELDARPRNMGAIRQFIDELEDVEVRSQVLFDEYRKARKDSRR